MRWFLPADFVCGRDTPGSILATGPVFGKPPGSQHRLNPLNHSKIKPLKLDAPVAAGLRTESGALSGVRKPGVSTLTRGMTDNDSELCPGSD